MALSALSDRFLLQGLAGTGGMGSVHRALDRRTGARVAVKIVKARGAGLAARFAVEAEALAALDHPAVVRFVDAGVTQAGQPFLAMEWIEGEDLAARLARGPLDPAQVIELGKRVAGALAAAHARGVVHRDIKPQNLLLAGGRIEGVKVVDFGIARLDPARGLTPAGALVGTPGYMAPEQARGAADIDARADIFSLGAVMFECLTGRPAFAADQTLAVLARLLLEEPPRIGALRPEVPAALARLIDAMLAKDPADRPQRAALVAEALEQVAPSDETGGEPAPRLPTEPPPPRALTGDEQRLVSVVALRPPGGQLGAGEIGSESETLLGGAAGPSIRELRATLEPIGARVDRLADGAVLLTWMSADAPADQAARAARGALLAQALVPGATIALASGLSDVSQPRPVGQVLDRAAALLVSDEAGAGVRVDAVVAGLLDVRFQVAQTSAGFELLGEDDIGQGARMLLGRPTPCVGRERELRALGDVVDACITERTARAVLVTAPAGTGKSRLRYELLRGRAVRSRGVEVWQARGDPMSAGSTFGALASAIRHAAGVPAGASIDARREGLRARVARRVPPADRARVAAFLGEIIGTPFPDDHTEMLRPARQSAVAMLGQVRKAWLDFVTAECAAQPVLLVLEDVHWGDTSSVALIDATLGALSEQPFMVLAFGRPEAREVFPDLWSRRRMHELRLEGLSRRAAAELVGHMLGAQAESARAAELVDRAEGNAFYLEEMIRAVAGGHGGALPETVLAMVQARLDALTADQRRALRAASVFGDAFWPGGVAALLGSGEDGALDASLDELIEREILVQRDESRFPDEPELAFRHALLREGAYSLLTEGDRTLGHALAAEWLERTGGADPAALAAHFDRGDQPARAAAYHLAAAERALFGNDMHAAIAIAEELLARGVDAALRARLERLLVEAYWFIGDMKRADAHADELLDRTAGGTEFAAVLSVKLMLAAELGSPERLSAAVFKLLGAAASGAKGELVGPHSMLVVVFAMSGPREIAAHHMETAEQLASGADLDHAARWFFHTARGQWRFVFESDFAAARDSFEEALAWAESTGDTRWGAFSNALLGWIYNVMGDFERSEEQLLRAIEASHPTGQARLIGRLVLSWTHSMHGRLEEGEAEARAAIETARGNGYSEGLGRTALAYVLMVRGELESAARELDTALRLLEMAPLLRTIVLAAAAELRVEQGRPREALDLAREALGAPGPCRVYPSSEYCARLAEIRALDALGDREGAERAARVAMDCLQAQAAKIGDERLRASFLRKPPWTNRIQAFARERLPAA